MMIIRRPLTEREHMLYQDSARSAAVRCAFGGERSVCYDYAYSVCYDYA